MLVEVTLMEVASAPLPVRVRVTTSLPSSSKVRI